MSVKSREPIIAGADDEPVSSLSTNQTFRQVIDVRMSRRSLLCGGLSAAAFGFLGGTLPGCGDDDDMPLSDGEPLPDGSNVISLLGFAAIAVSSADSVNVPVGYTAQVLAPWGHPLLAGAPAFDPSTNSGADQAAQVGSHHDGTHFFPIEGQSPVEGSSTDGLLVVNHEYVEPRFMHATAAGLALDSGGVPMLSESTRASDEVRKELNAHGVSVMRVKRSAMGSWDVVADDRNRRITGLTPMEIRGPVRGSALVQTLYSPDGTMTRGTLNNCGNGVTPWNTYIAAEENWAGYFVNLGERPREQSRYGVATTNSRYRWELADGAEDEFVRFDVTATAGSAAEDYRNEASTFGWLVEIDPFDETSTPVKRTALGRFAHEALVFQPAEEGKPVVCYSGDDAQFEYIYKFVSAQPYQKATAGGHLLDTGTLYVARFNDDGTGDWLPLTFGQGPLVPGNEPHGFASQADVLVNARLAADALGATRMDRPEWGAVHPTTGQVYFTLTNNTARAVEDVDAANPRATNSSGHIIRWQETAGDVASLSFEWDVFLLAGPTSNSEFAGQPLNDSQILSSPDGLRFDRQGRLWIQTDMSETVLNMGDSEQFGNNQMLACDPDTGDLRRFFTGPRGQEITGVATTPDQRTMFISVQHPGATTTPEQFAAGTLESTWPGQGASPRSATVVISKDDGGIIGS